MKLEGWCPYLALPVQKDSQGLPASRDPKVTGASRVPPAGLASRERRELWDSPAWDSQDPPAPKVWTVCPETWGHLGAPGIPVSTAYLATQVFRDRRESLGSASRD